MTSPTTGFIIVERFGAPVCVLKWHGTRTKGRGELSKTESASDEDMRASCDAMDSHKELSKVRFHRSGGWSYGWHGFDGIVAALRIASMAPEGPVVVVLPDSWDRYLSRDWAAQA